MDLWDPGVTKAHRVKSELPARKGLKVAKE